LLGDARPDDGAGAVAGATTCAATFIGTKICVRMAKITGEDPVKGDCKHMCLLNANDEFIEFLATAVRRRNFTESVRIVRTKDSR
jgi:hypothetical protein